MAMNALWSLIASEASERFYVNDAQEPAFLICRGAFSPKGPWTLYMNSISELGSFSSREKAFEKLREIVSKAKLPVKVYRESHGGKKILFAERLDDEAAGGLEKEKEAA